MFIGGPEGGSPVGGGPVGGGPAAGKAPGRGNPELNKPHTSGWSHHKVLKHTAYNIFMALEHGAGTIVS